MTPETAGMIGIALLVFLFLLRVPVAFSMAIVGLSASRISVMQGPPSLYWPRMSMKPCLTIPSP
jgi:hypothetical protein